MYDFLHYASQKHILTHGWHLRQCFENVYDTPGTVCKIKKVQCAVSFSLSDFSIDMIYTYFDVETMICCL